MRMLVVSCLLVAAAGVGAPASSPQASSSMTIRAARVFDGVTGQLHRNSAVTVADGRITFVGRAEGDAIDLGDVTLMPGLIDVHTHIDWHFGPDGRYGNR
ncbi:MAG TPA: hypothetical protein PKW63_17945, partial [Vicinamibacterales bacterium]|nr:hypothetical protein [Vicinamibacterales bacterium]